MASANLASPIYIDPIEIPKINTEVMLNVTNLSNFYEGTFYEFRSLDRGSVWYDILVDVGVRVTL
jgi:hypothetical protein